MNNSDLDEIRAKFYKYRSMASTLEIEWVERIVLHNELYFPAGKTFNDPFDLLPVISLSTSKPEQKKKLIELYKKFNPGFNRRERRARAKTSINTQLNSKKISRTEKDLQADLIQTINEKLGIYCATTNHDDILMWSHYADHHKGVCLEFQGESGLLACAQKVHYSQKRIPIKWGFEDKETSMQKTLLTKSECWAYENEWRLIDHEKGPGLKSFDPENLTGIVIGALASDETIALVTKWAEERSHPMEISRAYLNDTDYALNIKKAKLS